MFCMFYELKEEVLQKMIRLKRFQEPYNEKTFKKIKRLKSLQKAYVYLEPMQASAMELFCQYT